mgnify:CR=1 FL=1
MKGNKMLSQSVADNILSMITIEKRFSVGDKLPNELDLSEELNVSRTTLREAIRILVALDILEIQRGKGTYVKENAFKKQQDLEQLSNIKVNAKDLYEMRLIFEPEAAYYAALRATDSEIKRILEFGKKVEKEISNHQDRTDDEHSFHKAIELSDADRLVVNRARRVQRFLSQPFTVAEQFTGVPGAMVAIEDTINDHRMIMEFLEQRNAEGTKNAMKIHIMHAMKELGLD